MPGLTDVIIFFVGLTMWSDQIPNDCGVKAILPRVHTTMTPGATVPIHVQDHVAAIIFHADSFVSQEGWDEVKTLPAGTTTPTPPGGTTPTPPAGVFKYVVLDGDPVRFVTNGDTSGPVDLSGLTVPGLKALCPARQRLTAGYKTPYYDAAAVVFLPAGTLRTCLSVPEGSDGRLDTQLDLKTTGNLVIDASTMLHRKKLHLKPRPDGGPIEVMIANVPAPYYHGDHTIRAKGAADGMSHENAYYAMGEPGTGSCTTLRDWWNELEDPDRIFLCNARIFAALTPDPILTTTLSTSGANFECSNTRWP
jgi:hypothetical protein